MTSPTAPDRRAALKARHRAAILSAAGELVAERGGPRFTVDELAERADVARRTVFNHFASVDEVVLALCGEALDVIVEDFVATVAATPVGDGSTASMFVELAESLRSANLPSAIASIVTILGRPDWDDQRGRGLEGETLNRVGSRLVLEVQRRRPASDQLDAELLVGALMNGIAIIAAHWLREGSDRDEWDHLLAKLLERVRSGFAPTS